MRSRWELQDHMERKQGHRRRTVAVEDRKEGLTPFLENVFCHAHTDAVKHLGLGSNTGSYY